MSGNIDVSEELVEKGHGRIETRRARVCHDVDWLRETHDWPGLAAFGAVDATRETGDGTAAGTRYFIMSGTLSPERLLTAVRAHWRIENSLHWVLDVAMNEDGQRNRTGSGPENLAMMRRMALNLVRSAEERKGVSMRGRMKMAGWDHDVLLELVRAAARLSEEARKVEVQKR